MNHTFQDMIDALYRGKCEIYHNGRFEKAQALRDDPELMEVLVSCPSYHFGAMLFDNCPQEILGANEVKIVDVMSSLGVDSAAIVFDVPVASMTNVVMFKIAGDEIQTSICSHVGQWIVFSDERTRSAEAKQFIALAAIGLEMIANPSVQIVEREPKAGMKKFSENRVRQGQTALTNMKIVHLTKRIYICGKAIGGQAGSQAEKSPHDRRGHWRHSRREIRGWETVKQGEDTHWRKWINTFPVRGGKVALQSSRFDAEQYRVVR